jgi:hypothetical protein
MRSTRVILGAVMVACIAVAVYARTLAPGVTAGDSGELVLAAKSLGIPHPPGYPLWVLIAHLATLVPIGAVAARVNALSALFCALAAGALWLLGARCGLRPLGRAIACGLFAFATLVWRAAVEAEVYGLSVLAFVALAGLALEARSRRPGAHRAEPLFFFVAGLAAVVHQTLLFPGLLLGVWVLGRGFHIPRATAALGWALLGFSLVLFLPIRGAAHPEIAFRPVMGLAALPETLLRGSYGGLRQTAFTPSLAWDEIVGIAVRTGSALGIVGVALALGGAAAVGLRRTAPAVVTAAALAIPAALVALLGFRPDPEHLSQIEPFLAPVVVGLALLAGAGADAAAHRVRGPVPRRLASAALLGAVIATAVAHAGLCDQSAFSLPDRYGRELLAGLPHGATLVLDGDNETFLTAYARSVEGVRTDVTLIHRRGYLFGDPYGLRGVPRSRWLTVAHRVDLERLRTARSPIYYATPPADLAAAGVQFVNEGLVYRAVAPEGNRVAAAATPAASPGSAAPSLAPAARGWPRSSDLLPGGPARYDYVTRKFAVTWSDLRAQALFAQGRYAEALPWFRDAARVGFDFPEARQNLAAAAAAAGEPDLALSELLASHALDPRRAEPSARIAGLLATAGRYRDAARWFERAYGADPSTALAHDAARAWSLAGDPARSQRWSARALGAGLSRAPIPAPGSPDETLGRLG